MAVLSLAGDKISWIIDVKNVYDFYKVLSPY